VVRVLPPNDQQNPAAAKDIEVTNPRDRVAGSDQREGPEKSEIRNILTE
jgi:hypothetical protein